MFLPSLASYTCKIVGYASPELRVEVEAMRPPSGDQAIWLPPSMVNMVFLSLTSHTCTGSNSDPAAIRFPSGDQATEEEALENACPYVVAKPLLL